ncbi:MAG: hypothetical protein KKB90_07735 [Actinobacteria bacterium]|nr:hypothetical protein [Actinomycetota bacterium]MCG2819859.1 hypothetical protein [Actinomycetes bacterium]MBU4218840.1 hypothetical protein [Actinomycetota bacterium]MBU4359284.1 hypothetical protein [Actinomycetota bacterium]MBU4391870.1 hypothetical protein [Actinomycetota bacterium]
MWLYQDPDYTAHSRKVIVAYGEVTKHGETVSRSIETKVNYSAGDANMFDAFNFLVYQGDQAGAGEGFRQTFTVRNQFGSYDLDGLGAQGDGWGIYSVGPIELGSGWLAWDCNVFGNLISEDRVSINPSGWTDSFTLAPLDVHGTIYAGIDGAGGCEVTSNVNLIGYGDLYIGKIYAADEVSVSTWFNSGLLNTEGTINIDRGIECGGNVDITGVLAFSWGGGIDIGHAGNGPEDGIKSHGRVEADACLTDIDIGDIECYYKTESGDQVGVNFDAFGLGWISAGDIKSTGYVNSKSLVGAGINVGDIWAGTDSGVADGLSVYVDAAFAGALTTENIAARGRVDLFADLGFFNVGNIWAGYEWINTGLPASWQRRGVDITGVASGFNVDDVHSFGEVDVDVGLAGGDIDNVEAGTDANTGDGGTGVDVLVGAGGISMGNAKCRGMANIVFVAAGGGVGNIEAGTHLAGGHGGTGIYILGGAAGVDVGDCTCTGQLKVTSVAAVVDVDNCVVGTDSTTLVNNMGTGGDGVDFDTGAGGITAGNITSRGRVQLMPIAGFISTGNIVAGTEATTGNGGTGVNISGAINVVTTGTITSRGMVDILCAANVITTGNITAGTNSATARNNKLVGGTGVNIIGGAAIPVLGGITSHGKVNITSGLAIMSIGGPIYAGTDEKGNDSEYGGTGVNISTGAGFVFVNGGITSRGMVDLWALGAYIDVNGRVTAGTNNTSGNGGYGVDIDPILARVDMNGITSRGRVDLHATASFGIGVQGTINVGTDAGTSWGGKGLDVESTVSVGVAVTGLVKSVGVVEVDSTIATGCSFGGIHAGGTDTGTGYGGTAVDICSILSGVTVGASGVKSPGKIKIEGPCTVNGDVQGGSDNSTGNSGEGVHLKTNFAAGMTITGTIRSTGKTRLQPGLGGGWTIGSVYAGSDNNATSGTGLHIDRAGLATLYNIDINNTTYVGNLVYPVDQWSNITFGNIWTGHPVSMNIAGFAGLTTPIGVDGYIRTPSYVSLQGQGLTVNLSGIYCNGTDGGTGYSVYLRPYAGFFAGGREHQVGTIQSGSTGTVRLYPVHEGAKDNEVDVSGEVRCHAISIDADREVVRIRGGLKTRSSANLYSYVGTGVGIYSGDHIEVGGGIQIGGNLRIWSEEDFWEQDGTMSISGSIQATGTVTIDPEGGHNCHINNSTVQANGVVSITARDADEDLNFSTIKSRSNINIWLNNDAAGDFDCDGIHANGSVMVDADDNDDWTGGIQARGNVSFDTDDDSWSVSGGIKANGTVNLRARDKGTVSGGITARTGGSNIRFDEGYSSISGLVNCQGDFYIDYDDANNEDYNQRLDIQSGVQVGSAGTAYFYANRKQAACQGGAWVCWTSIDDYEWINVTNGYPLSYSRETGINQGGSCGLYWWGGCYTNNDEIRGGTYLAGSQLARGNPAAVGEVSSISTPTAYSYGYGQPSIPACLNPGTDLGISLPVNPDIHSSVNNIYVATSGTQEDLELEPEPAIPQFGGAHPDFPNAALASGDLPGWMSYTTEVLEGKALIPAEPSEPIWNASLPVTADRYRPDWSTLLPFGPDNRVKMPKPQWDWWRGEAEQDDIDYPATKHYWSGDATGADRIKVPTNCTDEVFFVEGDAEIDAIEWTNDAVESKATIVVYGHGATPDSGMILLNNGDLRVTSATDWGVFDKKELHLIVNDDIDLAPTGWGVVNIGENALYGFYAGDSMKIELALFHSILGSGALRGNLIAGNSVLLDDPVDFGWWNPGAGWYSFEYARPEIKPEGWMIPFKTGSWRELTMANWK